MIDKIVTLRLFVSNSFVTTHCLKLFSYDALSQIVTLQRFISNCYIATLCLKLLCYDVLSKIVTFQASISLLSVKFGYYIKLLCCISPATSVYFKKIYIYSVSPILRFIRFIAFFDNCSQNYFYYRSLLLKIRQ